MRTFLPALATIALLLSGCQTTTAFAPAQPGSRASGFWDFKMEQHRFRVSYRGGDGAPAAQVEDYALLRSAEVTLANGDDWFQVVARSGSASPGSSTSVSFGFGGASFGRGGGIGYGLGYGAPVGGGPQLTTNLEILTGKGAAPQGAYSARDVQRSIASRLPKP
jgi:hypothetical protein